MLEETPELEAKMLFEQGATRSEVRDGKPERKAADGVLGMSG